MRIPEPLPDESTKAYRALRLYVEQGDDRSMRKLAQQLHCSCQNLTIWARKYCWQDRIAAQRLYECQQKIAAEERATERQAEITEARRARVAERAFSVAEKFIDEADRVMDRHPVAAVRLLSTGYDVALAIAGAARGYQSSMQVHFETHYSDGEQGNPRSYRKSTASRKQRKSFGHQSLRGAEQQMSVAAYSSTAEQQKAGNTRKSIRD